MWRLALAALVAASMLAAPTAPAQEPAEVRIETLPLQGEIAAFDRLGGVAVDQLGYLYVTAFAEEIWKVAPGGNVELFADGFYGASGNAVDSNGDLLQSDFFRNALYRVDRRGEVTLVTDQGLGGPVAVAIGPEGDYYVCSCNDNRIVRVTRDGTASTFSESDLFSCPNGAIFDDQGDLFVVNFNNDELVKVGPDGTAENFVTVEPPGGWSQQALDLGVRGNAHLVFVRGHFFITKIKSNSLWRVGRDQRDVEHFGGNFTYGLDDGPLKEASLAAPNGIATLRGTLYMNNHTGTWRQLDRATLAIRTVKLPQ